MGSAELWFFKDASALALHRSAFPHTVLTSATQLNFWLYRHKFDRIDRDFVVSPCFVRIPLIHQVFCV